MGTGQYQIWEAIRMEQGHQRELLEVPTQCDDGRS
jgi:hypothetical protein